MSGRSVVHGSFSVERHFPASPQRVFAAWASEAAKARWFGDDEEFLASTAVYTLDFRVGGRERLEGMLPGGALFTYDAIYQDIVEGRRIIAAYDVGIGGRRVSVSLMTVEIEPAANGTRLVLTEHGAFLDGLDSPEQREIGAHDSMDKLGTYMAEARGEHV